MSIPSLSFPEGYFWVLASGPLLLFANALYNLFLHPLRHVPGPFWARASDLPSWYYTATGKRHIWLYQQFQIHGPRIRVGPNLVLFCEPKAYTSIYSMKANVRRSPFYHGLTMNMEEKTTLNTIDPAEHAARRKVLNTCFTDTSVATVSTFVIKHVDEWNQIMLDENGSTTDWSAPTEFSQKLDHLVFDIMGDISFGKSFNTKKPGSALAEIPHIIAQYLKFQYPMCRSPFLNFVVWLKPRGLDKLIEMLTPPTVQRFNKFVYENATQRLDLYEEQLELPEDERRRDLFYFLCQAKNSKTGLPAYLEADLRAEAKLLIIAGSDTTSISLTSVLWYLVRAPRCYLKVVDEILSTFKTPEDVVYGPMLMNCTYLRAVIDEGMRLVPPGPCEPPREVLAGGATIMGDYYPAGTVVGTAPWCDSRNEEVYGDPGVFRPERWIVDEANGVTKQMVAEIRKNFHPFLAGPGSCAGKSIAMAEMMIVMARTLHRFELRKAPGSTLGEGRPELGWGARDRKQFQVYDAYVSLREGPEIQFRKRAAREEVST